MRFWLFNALLFLGAPAWADHAYSLWGEPKYPPGFAHFEYAQPDAPKGGELRLVSNLRMTTFDKYNPFTIKGAAPAFLAELMFDTLLVGAYDETDTGYGLLAEDVQVAPDRLSVTFRLRSEARFHHGQPVLAHDVRHTFETLTSDQVSPAYATFLADVAGADVVDDRTIRFRFHKPNRELPMIVGTLPILSRDWGVVNGVQKPFSQVVMEEPIGSGPYRIGPVRFGRDITYVRDPAYWAQDLNVRRGMNNFDRITVKIYKDNTARLEALKAGEFDVMRFFSAGDWARRVTGKKFDSGELVKAELTHKMPLGFQSYVLNVRKPLLQDARVREALGLALDFEWMSRQMFYGAYQRVRGLFGNTACETTGEPSPEELALLAPWRKHVPAAVFGPMAVPPSTHPPHSLRSNLRKAKELLAEAGWTVQGGVLRNAAGEPFTFEYLDTSESGMRMAAPWIRNLEKLGITLRFRSVDYALYQQRLQKFDFDMASLAFATTNNPGQEFADLFGSKAADTPDSGNYSGIKNPAIDALITTMTSAESESTMRAACRALERVIVHSHILIPQWASSNYRFAYNAWRLHRPTVMPPYAPGESWVMSTWWANPLSVAPMQSKSSAPRNPAP